MNLWILSQDKDILTPINKMITINNGGIYYDGKILGVYKSKERAMEVLEEIKEGIIIKSEFNGKTEIIDVQIKALMLGNMSKVVEMPKE